MSGVCLLLCVLLFAYSATTLGLDRRPSFKELDSGARTFGTNPAFGWINNRELLLVVIKRTQGGAFTYSVARWDVAGGASPKTIKEFGSYRPELCVQEQFIAFSSLRSDGGIEAYHAKLDQPEQAIDPKNVDWHICQPKSAQPPLPAWTKDREIVALEKVGAGFVDFGLKKDAMTNTPVWLYAHGASDGAGRRLPFLRREIKPRFPYYPFKQAFFVEGSSDRYPRPRDVPYSTYWLYPDGRVEKIADVPYGAWRAAGSVTAIPTRTGLLLASSNFNVRNAADLTHAGLYLHTETGMRRLLKAWLGRLRVAVAPDGCGIAYSSASTASDKEQTLKAMNLCEGSRQ